MDASSPLAAQQVRSVQGIILELEAQDTPQILVLNKADAVAASEETARAARETSWQELHEDVTPVRLVATSARDGRGMEKLKAAVEAELLAICSRIECILPYAEAALLAETHKVGTIQSEEYAEDGTRLVAYVPASLRNRIATACELAGTSFEDEAPTTTSKPPAAVGGGGDAKNRKRGRLSEVSR